MRTFSMSAPTRSAMLASSFMKLILVASIALAAYLVSSDGADIHDDEPVVIADEGLVECAHELGGARVVGADDDPVGLHEVADRGALLEELGVGDDVELDLGAARGERPVELARAPCPQCRPARSTW